MAEARTVPASSGKCRITVLPRIVDHEERRRHVAEAAKALILEEGLEQVSVRRIARAVGYSTAVISHYFHNKQELLLIVYQMTLRQAGERVETALVEGRPAQACLEVLLPVDEPGRDNWKIWFAFWGMAMADPGFMEEQKMRGREAQKLVARVLEKSGIPPDRVTGRDMQARRILAVVAGLATQATYDPEGWPPERQRDILAVELDSLRVDARASPKWAAKRPA